MHAHTQFLLFVFLCSFAHTASANDVRLDLDPGTTSPLATCEVMDGVFTVTTSGADPYVTVKGVDTDYDNTWSGAVKKPAVSRTQSASVGGRISNQNTIRKRIHHDRIC